jgi:cytochrome P450
MMNVLLKSPFMALLIPDKFRKFDKFADDMIAERVYQELNQQAATDGEKPELRDDFVRLFRDEKRGFDQQTVAEVKSEATLLLIAGADTVATALSAILFYLTQHRRCLEKLVSELDSCVTTEQNIRRENVSRAKYLRACIDESLRLSPPLPGYLPREVTSSGATIAEQYFPPGVEVGVCIYALHLNPENYPHPFEFSPERWLVGEGNDSTIKWQQDLVLARSAFAPFSTGFASCVGREFAYMEMSLLLTRILYLYDIKRADVAAGATSDARAPGGETNVQYQLEDHFTSTGTGPWIQFRKRR